MYQKEVSECQRYSPEIRRTVLELVNQGETQIEVAQAPRHSATGLPQHKLVCLISNAMRLKNSNDCACRFASNRPKSTSKKAAAYFAKLPK